VQRRVVDIDSLAELDATARGAVSMAGWRVRHVDLRGREDLLARLPAAGALFLGCRLEPGQGARLEARGALVFPEVPGAPIDEYRATLYTPGELYRGLAGGGYGATLDARVYAWSRQPRPDAPALVARTLHDAAIDQALDRWVAAVGRPVVGVMGGHAVARDDPAYRGAAGLGRRLARAGCAVATGGGPGAMEAANLGAYVAAQPDDALDDALTTLASAPTFRPSIDTWAAAAFAVRARVATPDPPTDSPTTDSPTTDSPTTDSLGVPTWFYGHEPPNAFASHIAKFFQNSVREATLLERCTGGIVFLPGAAGTVQEVFQDACENYYADPAMVAPMVLVGIEHWTVRVPAWPLLEALAVAGGFDRAVALVDDAAAAAEFVASHRVGPA
jgi:predicted Rossmann-fold nucleotide-binding protein